MSSESASSTAAVAAVAADDGNASLPTTVLGTLRYAQRVHRAIGNSSPLEPDYQPKVALGVTLFLRLWSHIVNEGIFRRGESLREMSDLTLELLTVPFYLGTLCEKRQIPSSAAGAGNADGRQRGDSSTNSDRADDVARRIGSSSARLQTLTACNDFLFKFLKLCVDVKLCTERDVETKPFAAAMDRATRLEISKRRFALEDEVRQLEAQVQFARARARRNARIIRADEEAERRKIDDNNNGASDNDDEQHELNSASAAAAALVDAPASSEQIAEEAIEAMLEDDDDYQSLKRQMLVRFAEYCIFESYALLQGNAREMEVLGSLSDEEKRRAVEDFQRGLMSGGGAGGASTSAASGLFNRAQQAGRDDGSMRLDDPNKNYTVLPGGQVVPFGSAAHMSASRRQDIQREAFINRNGPTQSLEEFAEQEMAHMREMQEQEAAGKKKQQEEDERLGEEGVEERERQREARFNDWKDDNPCVGLTSKGNYA